MTLHLFVVLLTLLLFLLIQKQMLREPGTLRFLGSLNILIIYPLLPLSFPGMTVIADFFFEGVTDNLVWYSLIFIPLWMLSTYWMIKNLSLQKNRGWIRKAWLISMNILLLMGYICGIATSHHEHGPTPLVTDSMYLMGYFTGIHVAVVISLIMQVWLVIKSDWHAGCTWMKMLLTVVAMAIYLTILLIITTT